MNNSDDKSLPYVAVAGLTKSLEALVASDRVDCKGVIHHTDVLQHHSIRFNTGWLVTFYNFSSLFICMGNFVATNHCFTSDTNHFLIKVFKKNVFQLLNLNFSLCFANRHDATRVLGSSTNFCRFGLTTPGSSDVLVEVNEPLKSDYLLMNLPIINHFYEPCQSSGMIKGLDILVGNIVRGHSFTEKMLGENMPILAIGRVTTGPKLALFKNNFLLSSPLHQDHPFILTTLSRSQVVASIRTEARLLKLLYCSFALMGIGISSYVAYKYFKEHLRFIRCCWQYIRGTNPPLIDAGVSPSVPLVYAVPSNDPPHNPSKCCICLTNVRNLLLMPCKHLCICADCHNKLPIPKMCPVCRGPVANPIEVHVS